jgi:hypothetical protein
VTDVQLSRSEDVLNTYRYLRLAMVLLVVALGISVLWQVFASAPYCLQTSISAYYFTPARTIFAVALGAVGTCLIVYKGNSDVEDVLLNFSGSMAFIVAFVPTTIDLTCKASNVPTADELTAGVTNNGWALLITGAGAVVLGRIVNPSAYRVSGWSRPARIAVVVGTAVLLGGVAFFVFARSSFRDHAHDVAAVSLFAGVVLVVLSNAYSYGWHNAPDAGRARYANRYSAIAMAMLLTLVGFGAARLIDSDFVHWRFWLEAGVIAEFAVHWAVQTAELWNVIDRHQLPSGSQLPPGPGPTPR